MAEAELKAKVTVDNSQANAQLKQTGEQLQKLGGSAQQASTSQGNLATSVFKGVAAWDLLKKGVSTVSGFLKESYNEAAEAARGQAVLAGVLASTHNASGMTSKSVNELADALQKTTAIDNDVIISGQNMLLTFTHIGKDVFPQATKAMLDMATAMNGGASPSAEQLRGTAIQLGRALNDPLSGMTKLQRIGVAFTETQKQQIEGFVKAGQSAKAQQVILDELGTEFGGLAERAKTPMKEMQTNLGNLKEEIGNQLMPIVREYSARIAENVLKITDFIASHKETIATIAKVVLAGVGAIGVVMGITKAVNIAKDAFMALKVVMMSGISPFQLIILGAALLAAGLMYLSDRFGGLGNAMKAIGLSFQAFGEVFVIFFKYLGNKLIEFINWALDKGNKVYNFFADLLRKVNVDIGSADLKIDFKFDTQKSISGLMDISKQLNQMQAAAQKAKDDDRASLQRKIADEQAAQDKMAQLSKGLQDNFAKEAAAAAKAGDKGKDAAKKHAEAVANLKAEYANFTAKVETQLADLAYDHQKNMNEISANILKVKGDMGKLVAEYQRAQGELSKGFNTQKEDDTKSIAEKIVDSEKNIADLKKQIAEETDADKLVILQKQLSKEQEAYDANKTFIASIDTAVVEARRRASLTDLQRAIEDFQAKRAIAQAEYDNKLQLMAAEQKEKMAVLKEDLAKYQNQMAAEVASYDERTKKIQEMVKVATDQYIEDVKNNYKATEEYINKEIDLYKALASAIAQAASASSGTIGTIKTPGALSGKRAAGGPVMGGGAYLVGEAGPEVFMPSQNGSIVPNNALGGGGGVTVVVNVTGNKIANDMDLRNLTEKVSDRIVSALRLNRKFSV